MLELNESAPAEVNLYSMSLKTRGLHGSPMFAIFFKPNIRFTTFCSNVSSMERPKGCISPASHVAPGGL